MIPNPASQPQQEARDAVCSAVTIEDVKQRDVDFTGSVTFHELPFLGGKTATMALTSSQRCYNADLAEDFDGGSMSWEGLPAWSSLNTENTSRLMLFSDSDCQTLVDSVGTTTGNIATKTFKVRSLMLELYWPFSLKKTASANFVMDRSVVITPPFNGTLMYSLNGSRIHEHTIDQVETCYNIGCVRSDFTLSWKGLPTEGRIFKSASAIAIYHSENCRDRLYVFPVNEDNGELTKTMPWTEKPVILGASGWSVMLWINREESTGPAINDGCIMRRVPSPTPAPATGTAATKSWWWPVIGTILAITVIAVVAVHRVKATARGSTLDTTEVYSRDLSKDPTLHDIRLVAEDIMIDQVVGTTNMAIVYTALCQSHAVIVKKLLPELKANKFAREALIYEAKLVSQLDHPKIVRCVGLYWTPHGDLGLVYEPMGGTNLATFLHEYKQTLSWTSFTGEAPFRRPPKLRIALDLAEALTLLHSYDPPIVHGKLSAENVLLTSHSVAKIWNFQPVVDQNFNSFLEHVEQGITKPAGSTTCDIVAFGGLLVNLGAIDEDQAASTPKPGARMERTNSSCRVKLAELCRCCLGGRNGDHPSALQVFAELNHLHKSLGVQSHIQLGK